MDGKETLVERGVQRGNERSRTSFLQDLAGLALLPRHYHVGRRLAELINLVDMVRQRHERVEQHGVAAGKHVVHPLLRYGYLVERGPQAAVVSHGHLKLVALTARAAHQHAHQNGGRAHKKHEQGYDDGHVPAVAVLHFNVVGEYYRAGLHYTEAPRHVVISVGHLHACHGIVATCAIKSRILYAMAISHGRLTSP